MTILRSKQIVVTGGSGFIGTHLTESLLSLGHRVVIFDQIETPLSHPNLTYIKGDTRKTEDLKKIINTNTDLIFHFAAIVSVPQCEESPNKSFETNLAATQKLLDLILNFKNQKNIPIIFASSAAIYGNLSIHGQKLNETDHLPEPLSFYGLHKYASEQLIRLYCLKHGIRGLSFRFFNVYGPGQKPDSPYSGVFTIFKKSFKENETIKLFNNGQNSRDFIHVNDIARACTIAINLDMEKLDGQPINLCTGISTLIRDLYLEMCKYNQRNPPVENHPPRKGDIEYSCGNPETAEKKIGFKAKIIGFDLEEI